MKIRYTATWNLILLLLIAGCSKDNIGDAAKPVGSSAPTTKEPAAPSGAAPQAAKQNQDAPRTAQAAPAEQNPTLPGNRSAAITFENWLVPSKGNEGADHEMVGDVRLERPDPDQGVFLVKTAKSGNVWVFPDAALEGDGMQRLTIKLPAIQELMTAGAMGGMISVGFWPDDRELPIPLGPTPPPMPQAQHHVTIELRRTDGNVMVIANGRPLGPPAKFTAPVRLGLLTHDNIFFWLEEATIDVNAAAVAPRTDTIPQRPPQVARNTPTNPPANQQQPVTEAPAENAVVGQPVQELKLPATMDDAVVAAGGTQLVLHLKKIQRLAVIDLLEGKLRKLLTCDNGNALLAGGADALLVIHPDSKRIERWNLQTLEMDQAIQAEVDFDITAAALGAASQGPLMIAGGANREANGVMFYDVATLLPRDIKVRTPANSPELNWNEIKHLRASSDGQTFGFNCQGGQLLMLSGDMAELTSDRNVRVPIPDPRGETLYTENGRRTQQFQKITDNEPGSERLSLPAVQGGLFVSVLTSSSSRSGNKPRGMIALHLPGQSDPLAEFDDLSLGTSNDFFSTGTSFHDDKRLVFHELSGTLAMLPHTNDRVLLKRIDTAELLNRAGADYLYVSSLPPRLLEPGQTYNYQIAAHTNNGPVQYEVTAGPEGLSLSDTGQLTWPVPETAAIGDRESIILSIKDAQGRSIYHTITVAVPAAPGAPPVGLAEARRPDGSTESARIEKNSVSLPTAFDDVKLAGGGRYLLLYMKTLRKIALFDVQRGEIDKYFDLDDDNVLFAGGRTKLIVVVPERKEIQRWNLATGKREQKAELKTENTPTVIAMGHDSEGPLYVATDSDFRKNEAGFINIRSLRPQSIQWNPNQHYLELGRDANVRVSANGKLFTGWRLGTSPAGIIVLELLGNRAESRYEHTTAGYLAPSADGLRIFTANGIYTNQIKRLDEPTPAQETRYLPIPAVSGDYYLTLPVLNPPSRNDGPKEPLVNIHAGNETDPLVTIHDIDCRGGDYTDNFAREVVTIDKRLLLCPQFGLLVVLPESNDRVVLMKVALDELLKLSGRDYLLVTSSPPGSVAPGAEYRYQVEAKSNREKLRYRIASGPDGMSIDADGLLTWNVPADQAGTEHNVILSITDSAGSQERFQTFAIEVEGTRPAAADVAAAPADDAGAADVPGVTAPPAATQLPLEARIWTDDTGQFQVRAVLTQILDGKVRLRKPDGSEIQVEIERLSEQDQQYLLALEQPTNEGGAPEP